MRQVLKFNRIILFLAVAFSLNSYAGKTISSAASKNPAASSKNTPAPTSSTSSNSSGGFSIFKSGFGQEVILSSTIGGVMMTNNVTNLNLHGAYGYFMQPKVEGILDFSFTSISGSGSSTTTMSLIFEGLYHFQDDYHTSYFALLGLGFGSTSTKANSTSGLAFRVGGGKRIPVWANVGLMPVAYFEKIGNADMSTNVIPLNFSILF